MALKPAGKDQQRRKDRILDAAEILFAKHGFDGVTLRKVAALAEVDLALASYHFGSKQGLFDAVLLRRAEVLNERRLAALEACERAAAPKAPAVEEIVRAFLAPMFAADLARDPGWQHYFELIAYVNNAHDMGGRVMTQFFNPLVVRFMDVFKRAMPDTPHEQIYWSYHFMSAALSLTFAQTERMKILSGGAIDSRDLEAAVEQMIPFVTAGFERLCKTA
ncbi:TetR/AcrR family transcriptional regulator [Gimibacter soli]|uniref:TetR family transcriptional regulator n=1 Tax=Gimibacter soli TaxID=3024400 RepID=A0AAE9XK72_9PROT|nr:TetR/AcrR family transcriptional regulator [Gimibacter soli]WCL52699.1 TetR family transcriptional regulator [Gimibacter soli]